MLHCFHKSLVTKEVVPYTTETATYILKLRAQMPLIWMDDNLQFWGGGGGGAGGIAYGDMPGTPSPIIVT